ncbi:preprotein translocase subunit SecE [Propionibacteriaceae bacterium G57]|uniref:preprotein translocase subunit SecE n=1 Tax=Aestuariimicrobium sp. G57 TaxID=3418485 RepID=UPI003DA740FE
MAATDPEFDDEQAGDVIDDEAGTEDPADLEDPAGEDLAAEADLDTDYIVVDDEAEELTDADDEVDDTPDKGDPEDVVIDDEQQLAEAESVAAKAKSTRPAKRKVTTAPVKKDRATPKQDKSSKGVEKKKRTGPIGFAKQSGAELKKVIWPTGDQLREYFIVVLVFVLLVVGFVSLLDLGYGRLLLWWLA